MTKQPLQNRKWDSEIELLPFESSDISQLLRWIPTAEFLLQWAGPGYSFPLTEAQIMSHITGRSGEKRKTTVLKGVLKENDLTIGHGEILGIDPHQRSAVLGRILIGPVDYRGKGYGLQLVRRLIRYAFENNNIHRLSLNVFSDNLSAIKCYAKSGFVKEGELRDARFFKSKFISVTMMSLLRPEYNGLYKQVQSI